jgi:hypothetical protein
MPFQIQLAPLHPANDTDAHGHQLRLGVEGLDMQHILMSLSKDPEGRRWVAPQVGLALFTFFFLVLPRKTV